MEGVPELEGQHDDVDPCDLGDGDAVGDGKGGVEDAFGAGEDFVEGGEVGLKYRIVFSRVRCN